MIVCTVSGLLWVLLRLSTHLLHAGQQFAFLELISGKYSSGRAALP